MRRGDTGLMQQMMQQIETEDFHTGGEPYRIVIGGVAVPEGATVLDRREWSEQHLDDVRAFLINEPRGHADMYGCFVTPPDADDALGSGAFGMVFFHKDGFSTACGHGTIAGTTWALTSGIVAATAPRTNLLVDVPSGRLQVEADVEITDGSVAVGEVRFENVPSFVSATGLSVHAAGLNLAVDVSYGGAFYASADVAQLGVDITPDNLPLLIEIGRAIKWTVNDQAACQHPVDPRLSGCYGTIWYQHIGTRDDGALHQRNVTIFADGEVDRSPCGSGSSARLTLLDHQGTLHRGQLLHHESVIGSTFTGQVVGDAPAVGTFPCVRTVVGGRAHRTGYHRFVLDPADSVGLGFQLR